MNCLETILGIDAIPKESLHNLVSKEGYFETVQNGLDMKQRFDISIDESKHTCILDVDHTLLFVRYFGDEMAVDDIVQYHGKPARVRSMIFEIQVREQVDSTPEFKTASYRAQIQHQDVPVKGSMFTYIVEKEDDEDDEETDSNGQQQSIVRHSVVINSEAVGCEIECESEDGSIVQISFEDDSPELFALKPDMNRAGYAPVELLHDGFLVRFRPHLADFLNTLNEHFNVILFTAAEKDVYEGLLARVHSKLMNTIESSSDKLWSSVLFRDSCDLRRFGPNMYHVKNLCKFGIDMGRIFIIDNNPGSFRGFEPNAICCGDYFGAQEGQDDVLFTEVIPIVKKIVVSQTTDLRYVLCDVPADLWGDESPREDSRCEEEVAGATVIDNEFAEASLLTTVQSRRHSFHAGSTSELSREIQLDRTIQFLKALRRHCSVVSPEHSKQHHASPIVEALRTATAGSSLSISCAGGNLSALLRRSTPRDGVETDSENDSVRTMVINDDLDIVMMEAGGVCTDTPRSSDEHQSEQMKFIGRNNNRSGAVDSSMSLESNDEVLAMMGQLDDSVRVEIYPRRRRCCVCCLSWRRFPEGETHML